jgi:hypothetical protein
VSAQNSSSLQQSVRPGSSFVPPTQQEGHFRQRCLTSLRVPIPEVQESRVPAVLTVPGTYLRRLRLTDSSLIPRPPPDEVEVSEVACWAVSSCWSYCSVRAFSVYGKSYVGMTEMTQFLRFSRRRKKPGRSCLVLVCTIYGWAFIYVRYRY